MSDLYFCKRAALALAFLFSFPAADLSADEIRREHVDMFPGDREGEDLMKLPPLDDFDSDLGEYHILQPRELPPRFELVAALSAMYNDNVLLQTDDRRSDSLLLASTTLNFRPHLIREWNPVLITNFFLEYRLFRYGKNSALDFDGQSTGIEFTYLLPNDFSLYGGWTGSRLVDRADYNRFFRESGWTAGLRKTHPVTNRTALFGSLQADVRHTTPSSSTRADGTLTGGWSVSFAPGWTWTGLYRLARQEYLQQDRLDWNHGPAGAISWRPAKWATLRVNGGYTWNHATRSRGNNYQVGSLGGGGSVHFRF